MVGTGHADAPGELRAALEGIATLRRSAGALALLLLMACTSVIQGSNETLTVTFNDEVLGLPESTAGLLAGAYGVGIALGGITLAGLAQRSSLAPVVLSGALLLGLAQASVALLDALAPVVIMLMLVGVGIAMIMVSARTLLQRTTDDGVLARVLAVQEGVHLTGLTIGALVGPLVIALFGPSAAFVPGALLILGIGLLAGRSIHQLDAVAVDHSREVSLLGRVPFLAALPPYELERLAQGAEWVSVAAGTEVVTQGDEADSYYLVASGELSVTIDGVRRAQTMVAGDGFGEIALLNRVARTATVTALEDCELLVVSSGDFLGAVTATPDGEGLAHEISRRDWSLTARVAEQSPPRTRPRPSRPWATATPLLVLRPQSADPLQPQRAQGWETRLVLRALRCLHGTDPRGEYGQQCACHLGVPVHQAGEGQRRDGEGLQTLGSCDDGG